MFIYLYFFLESEISEMLRALSSNLFVKVTTYRYLMLFFGFSKFRRVTLKKGRFLQYTAAVLSSNLYRMVTL